MLPSKTLHNRIGAGLSAAALMAVSGGAHALAYQLGEIDVNIESSITAGVAIRGQDAGQELVGKANQSNAVAVDSSFQGAYSTNGDDGNQAFGNAGDLFFSQLKFSSDLTLRVGDWGIFARGNYRYDPNIKSDKLTSDFDYGPNRARTFAEQKRREDSIEDDAGNDAELFDLYLFGNFQIGDRSASIRLGRQVFNWGEATFISNGINSIVPVDARQARGPGAEVKEIFRPFGAAWASLELIDNVSLEAFYQFDFEPTIIDPSGTYFSTSDFLGAGAADVQIGFGRCNENLLGQAFAGAVGVDASQTCGDAAAGTNVPQLAADTPSDGGQYGFRLNTFIEPLNATELSLYYVNYHSRLPLLNGQAANLGAAAPGDPLGLDPDQDPRNIPGAGFRRVFPEDIQLYGMSFNTFFEPLEIAVQGEYSFHKDQPLQIDDVDLLLFALTPLNGALANAQTIGAATGQENAPGSGLANPGQEISGFQRFDYHQWNLSFTKFIGPSWTGANQIVLLGEFAGQHVEDLPDTDVLPFEAPATYVPNQALGAAALGLPSQDRAGYADDFAWGYRLVAAFRYQGVLNRFNLTPSVRFFHDVKGNSPTPISTFLEERKQVVAGVSAEYLDAWEAGMSYTWFFGSNDSAAPPINTGQVAQRLGGYESNVVADRDFFNLFVRYNF